jgi:hypothetical protein
MKTAPVRPAVLHFEADGTPASAVYDDIYHARAGALAQARHVFLGGNGLPARWQGRPHFDVLETGSRAAMTRLFVASLLASWSKPEGALFVLLLVGVLCVRQRFRFVNAWKSGGWALVVPPILHSGLMFFLGRPLPQHDFDLTFLEPRRWSELLSRFGVVLARILTTEVLGAWIPLLAMGLFLLLTRRGLADSLLAVFALQILAYLAAFSISSFDPIWKVDSCFDRIVATLFPALALVLGARLASPQRDRQRGDSRPYPERLENEETSNFPGFTAVRKSDSEKEDVARLDQVPANRRHLRQVGSRLPAAQNFQIRDRDVGPGIGGDRPGEKETELDPEQRDEEDELREPGESHGHGGLEFSRGSARVDRRPHPRVPLPEGDFAVGATSPPARETPKEMAHTLLEVRPARDLDERPCPFASKPPRVDGDVPERRPVMAVDRELLLKESGADRITDLLEALEYRKDVLPGRYALGESRQQFVELPRIVLAGFSDDHRADGVEVRRHEVGELRAKVVVEEPRVPRDRVEPRRIENELVGREELQPAGYLRW